MAKSKRSSSKKFNNQRKAAAIYGPAESARAERLSQRLLEVAKQPRPESSDVDMNAEVAQELKAAGEDNDKAQEDDENTMEIDSASKPSRSRLNKHRINKRKQKKSGIIFPKYGDMVAAKKKKNEGK